MICRHIEEQLYACDCGHTSTNRFNFKAHLAKEHREWGKMDPEEYKK